MARMPRLVVPHYPHHITQRGARRMKTFFTKDDYQYYLDLVAEYKAEAGVEVWAYCSMPSHVLSNLEDLTGRDLHRKMQGSKPVVK